MGIIRTSEFARTTTNGTILEMGSDAWAMAEKRTTGQFIVALVRPHVVGDKLRFNSDYVEEALHLVKE